MKCKVMIVAVLVMAGILPANGQQANVSQSVIGRNMAVLSLDKPVERVNGTVLTQRDLLREMYTIFPYARQHNGFPKAMEADIRRGALMMITFEELVYQEAKRRNMTIAPERLARAERQFRKQFDSEESFRGFLQTEGIGSTRLLRVKIERSLLIEDLLKAEVTSKSAVTLAEARAFYLNNPERFKLPELYALQTITVMPPQPANPKQAPTAPTAEQKKQMKSRADDALRQARETKTFEDFGILAEKISEDDYRVMMGKHKPLPPAQLPPEILQTVSKLQPGQISGLIEAEGAYTIVRLDEHTAPRTQPFAEISKTLQSQMQKKKAEKLQHDFDDKLRTTAKIEQL